MTERQYGILGTVVVHNIIVLILLFTYIVLSKPIPSEGGILINFGDVESAGGLFEPALNNLSEPFSNLPDQPSEAEEGILTQEHEEAPAVKSPSVTKKTEAKPVKQPEQSTSKTTEKTPVVNKKALYESKDQSKTESGSSAGIYKGQANMGDPSGTTESDNYSKGLGGSGIAFNLNGRYQISLPEPEFNIHKEGDVVVEITVDRTGKVISASPGIKGSTIVDNTLYAAAKKAALESKFNVKNDAPDRQVGTITYHFRLK